MYVQIPRNRGIPAYANPPSSFVEDANAAQNEPEGFIASLGMLVLLLTAAITCLSFIKKSVRYFTGNKPKKAIECTRISVISVADSTSSATIDMARFLTLHEFREHYKGLAADSFYKLSVEFESLKVRGELMPFTEGDRGLNRPKNRFVNVLPFDHTRFILNPIDGKPGSDYVNANYVSGYYSRREYLATQGPLQNTANDFWRMCWESGAKCVVMLTRCVDKGMTADREKCFRYWPSCSLPEPYGEVEVEIISERLEGFNNMHKWIITEFKIRNKGQQRHLRHYQFLTWPDFESIEPPEALVYFIRQVRKYAPYPANGKNYAPVVIHCSAGVGRTGTFIGVDIAMNQILKKQAVNIPGIINQMRKERVWMVQTEHQYTCIYKCAIAVLDELQAKKEFASRKIVPSRKMTKEQLEDALNMNLDYAGDDSSDDSN